jgi:hypothetical protein
MRVLLPLSKRSLPPFLVPKEDERAFPPYSSHFPAPGSSFHFLISLSFFFFFFRVFWKPNLLSTHYLFGFFSPTRHLLQSPTPPSPFSFLSLLFFFFFLYILEAKFNVHPIPFFAHTPPYQLHILLPSFSTHITYMPP